MPLARKATRISNAAFVTALILLVVLAYLAWRVMGNLDNATRWIMHTRAVLAQSSEVQRLVVDAESAARGYAVIGDPRVLEPYRAAMQTLPEAMGTLQALVRDNPDQTRRVSVLVPLIEARMEHSTRVVELREMQDVAAARELIQAGYGADLMERVRKGLAELEMVEGILLEQRLRTGEREAVFTRLVLLLLTATALASLAASWWFNRRALSELRRLEVLARAGEARLLVTLQSCGDGLIVTDEEGKVTMLNPVAQALTGWREEQARGLPLEQIFRIVNEFSRAEVESPVGRVLREGKVVGLANHTVLIARDGSERPIDDSGAPVKGPNGEILGVVLVFRDVSARRHAEIARERLLRAEAEREGAIRASEAKDQFLALVSHELRAPLAAIRGWLHLLMSGFVTSAAVPDALQRIYRNTRLQERLVNDLLDVSRIAAGKLEVLRAPIDLVEVVHAAFDECRPIAEQKSIRLALRCDESGLYVLGDEQRLVQVVSNILGNAIKFTPAEGEVTLALERCEERVVVTVCDNGVGMTAEVMEHLFDRFWQADSSRTRDQGGLGLGLTIAKYLVEEHKGRIQVCSEGLQCGATFTVELPLLPVGAAVEGVAEQAVPVQRDLSGVHVLLVDDDADSRDALQIFLDVRGATVYVADSVDSALRVFERSRPAVVVSDISMPHADGYSLAETIRQREQAWNGFAALIALTGFAADSDRRTALAHGFDDHLGKPIDLEQLASRIRHWSAARTGLQ
ncbi:MAG: CHASE3 domain-containing protein [Burkholderiales bacterium]|nr:CHASE3 domain-containing protein [Burkholderiales bacterium]